MKEDLDNNQCQTVTCEGGKVLKGDGTCADACPDYENQDANNKCQLVTCQEGEKLSLKGVCAAACPEFYEDANADGKCTIFPDHACGDAAPFQKGNKECVKACPEYLFTEQTKKRCQTITCAGEQLLKADGTCVASCPDYTKKSDDKKRCEAVTCEGATKLLKKDGTCTALCPDYEKASDDGKTCVAGPVCTDSKKLTVLGVCVDTCPDFFKASDDGKKCEKIENVCKDKDDGNVYMKKDGATCVKKCDDFMLTKGNECHEVKCAEGKFRTLGGLCLDACP